MLVIKEGVLLCLYQLSKETDSIFKEKAAKILSAEFNLSDWEKQVKVINKLLGEKKVKRRKAKYTSRNNIGIRFPKELTENDLLLQIRNELRN